MLPGLGIGELVLILAIIILLFGAKRLPEIAKAVGSSMKAFKDGMNETDRPAAEKPPEVK